LSAAGQRSSPQVDYVLNYAKPNEMAASTLALPNAGGTFFEVGKHVWSQERILQERPDVAYAAIGTISAQVTYI
jgi:hypothetical protein